MAQQYINIGTTPNDGTGDVMRVSFTKTDNNFSELYFTSANLTSNLSNLSNTVEAYVGDLYLQLGETNDKSNVAANLALYAANTANATKAIANTVNSAWNLANAAFDYANGTVVRTNVIYTLSNSAFDVANAAFNFANNLPMANALALAGAAYDQANLSFQLAGEAFDLANVDFSLVSGCIANTTSAYNFSNGVSTNTTSAYRVANSVYVVANSNYGTTNSVYYSMNAGYTVANAAYGCANTKVNTVNGIITGTFTVQGNEVIQGQSKFQGPHNYLEIIDGSIYINGVLFIPTPVGQVIYMASSNVPDGYLLCDGSAVSRSTYASLFAQIATTYGPGNGSTTFNLPDLRGTFIRGWDNGRGLDSDRQFGSYQLDLFASHTHTDSGHTHSYGVPTITTQALGFSGSNYLHPELSGSSTTGSGFANLSNTGGAETRPKNVALLPCIKY